MRAACPGPGGALRIQLKGRDESFLRGLSSLIFSFLPFKEECTLRHRSVPIQSDLWIEVLLVPPWRGSTHHCIGCRRGLTGSSRAHRPGSGEQADQVAPIPPLGTRPRGLWTPCRLSGLYAGAGLLPFEALCSQERLFALNPRADLLIKASLGSFASSLTAPAPDKGGTVSLGSGGQSGTSWLVCLLGHCG